MTDVETGNQPVRPAGPNADGLDDLRADLARMILNEAGRAVSQNPDLPLSLTLVRAIERQSAQSAQSAAERIPTPQALSDAVLDAVGPELIRIARAAGTGDTVAMARRRSQDGLQSRTLIGVGVAIAVGVLLFIAGFVTARLLPDRPVEPAPVAAQSVPAPALDQPGAEAASTPAAAASTSPVPPAQ